MAEENLRTLEIIKSLILRSNGKITTEKQLLLTYWMKIDNVSMDKTNIITIDFLEKATDPCYILDSLSMLETIEGRRLLGSKRGAI